MQSHLNEHELVMSWDDGSTAAGESRVTHHLAGCETCRTRAERLRAAMEQVSAMYAADESATPATFRLGRQRLEAALHEAASTPAPQWWTRMFSPLDHWPLVRGLATGAAVVGACVALLAAVPPASGPGASLMAYGALPESTLTPGAVSAVTEDELCNGVRPSRLVTESVRQGVLRAYDMEGVPAAAYELDALITPELGGSTDPANLWPQLYHSPVWNARVKDELEALLPRMVCARQITLAQAQQEIASDWISAYKRHFNTDQPLRAHMSPMQEEEAELVFVADSPRPTQVARSGW
jgi:hypothetical protein